MIHGRIEAFLMFFCGLLLGIKSRPKLIQKEPFGGYIGVPDPDHPAQCQLPTPKKNNFNLQKKARALAAPLSGRDTAVFNLGVQLHTIMPHASSYLATCEQQVIGACCMFAIAAAAIGRIRLRVRRRLLLWAFAGWSWL